MNVEKIVKDYLNQNGYGGLCTSGCGCETNDLAPCLINGILFEPKPGFECKPGYLHTHSVTGEWIIATDKTPKTDAEIEEIIKQADI